MFSDPANRIHVTEQILSGADTITSLDGKTFNCLKRVSVNLAPEATP